MNKAFQRFSGWAANVLGSPWVFVFNLLLVIGWVVSGPHFGFSDTWQLAINTSTTIITYLAVFIIQASQNRDTKAIHLKLDELIQASNARDEAMEAEKLTTEQMNHVHEELKDKYYLPERNRNARDR